jgi:CRISPR-associated endonuclease Csn1
MPDLPSPQLQKGLILGIDLGSSSLGTALVNLEGQEIPFLGVRIFPAGVVGDIEEGREESRSAQRRNARLARRQTQRRQRRLYKVFRSLQRMGLLPAGPRVEVLYKLQRELERRYPETTVVPYFLRARALDRALDVHELGRALYHLAQRRGFLSNRVGGKEDAEERSKVKGSIKGLRAAIEAAGKRTLGEYMASLDPRATPIRNKPEFSDHYTHRSMYLDEFKLIWEAQQPFHAGLLSEAHRVKLQHAMFHQRPLKDQSNLVGQCELEPEERRAPLRLLASQRFRVLGFVNNLRVRLEDGNERSLMANERATLLDLCEKSEKLSFAAARRALGCAKSAKFTIEEGGEKNVPVNLVATRLRAVLGEWWEGLTPEAKDDLVEDVGDGKRCKTDEDLELCAREKWGLNPEIAEDLGKVRLPDAYGRYSLKALSELLPALESGLSVEEAIRSHPQYVESRKVAEPLPLLPPVKEVLGEIRNPAVLRSLTELRKTVNAIVRRYGKPEFMHVELARDLKKSKKERQAETGRNRDREKLRQLAVDELRRHDPVRYANPRGNDIEKYLLAMESNWHCPYTDRKYGFVDVFGEHPSVDVEHIIPRSRSLDDSYLNKVLAYRSANMEKGKRTPHEWLHESDLERYDRMIALVNGFDSRFEVGRKLRRFSMELTEPDSLLAEFTARQLQETRYASKLACRYLGVLYGGEVDAEGNRRVFACAGQVTAKLRKAWDLNQILNPVGKPEKSRDDHRHHAVDALTIALTSTKMVRDLANAAGEADRLFRRKIILPVPWVNFADAARTSIEAIQVSHRPARKLSGPLHEETFYSRPRKYSIGVDAKGKPIEKEYVHFRVPVTKLASKAAAEDIVDVRVREAVMAKAEELGGGGNKFQNNWPVLHTRHGGSVPIKRVRIRKVQSVVPIGKEGRERFVISGSNHHAEIVAEMDAKGNIKRYVFSTVTMLEALERKRQGVPVVQRDHGPGKQFLCTLSEGDMVEAKRPGDGADSLWKVRGVRQTGQMDLTPACDARLKKDIAADKQLWKPSVGPLFSSGARKVLINHLGEVLPAND